MTTQRSSIRLGHHPAKQGPRPQSDWGWVQKSATGTTTTTEMGEGGKNRLKLVTQNLPIGTWNVRTLWSTGKLGFL